MIDDFLFDLKSQKECNPFIRVYIYLVPQDPGKIAVLTLNLGFWVQTQGLPTLALQATDICAHFSAPTCSEQFHPFRLSLSALQTVKKSIKTVSSRHNTELKMKISTTSTTNLLISEGSNPFQLQEKLFLYPVMIKTSLLGGELHTQSWTTPRMRPQDIVKEHDHTFVPALPSHGVLSVKVFL